MPWEPRTVSLWMSVQTKLLMLKRLRVNSFHWILCPRQIFTCLQSNHGSTKRILHIFDWCVFKSWGKEPAVLSSVSSLSHMCALGMAVNRRAGVGNSAVFWVVVVLFRILTWVVAPGATNHHRAAKETKCWTDPASIQGESERHQAVLVKHSDGEPHRRHHPTQSWKQEEGHYNVVPESWRIANGLTMGHISKGKAKHDRSLLQTKQVSVGHCIKFAWPIKHDMKFACGKLSPSHGIPERVDSYRRTGCFIFVLFTEKTSNILTSHL